VAQHRGASEDWLVDPWNTRHRRIPWHTRSCHRQEGFDVTGLGSSSVVRTASEPQLFHQSCSHWFIQLATACTNNSPNNSPNNPNNNPNNNTTTYYEPRRPKIATIVKPTANMLFILTNDKSRCWVLSESSYRSMRLFLGLLIDEPLVVDSSFLRSTDGIIKTSTIDG
jgi:hypothetical protein